MKHKIRLSLILIAVLSVILASIACVYLSYNTLINQALSILKAESVSDQGYAPYIRVTRVAADGVVTFDSMTDSSTMGNHLDRKEIRLAFDLGEGSAVRRSDTVNYDTIYYALRQDDGSVLRLAMMSDSVWSVLREALPWSVAIMVLLILASLPLTAWLTERIVKPMEKALRDSDEFQPVYDELIPFSLLLKEKNAEITAAIKGLKQQQQEIALITGNMSEGMIFTDNERHIQMINRAAFRLFGVEELLCTGNSILYFSRDKKLIKAVKKAEKGKTNVIDTEAGTRQLRLSASPVSDSSGSQIGVVLVISDVTEQKQAEQIRRDFTANVSHELKTPLTSIIGYSELLAGGVDDQAEVKKFATVINKEAQRLMELISDILALSKLENPHETGEMDVLSIKETVELCIDSIKIQADAKDVSLSVDGADFTVFAERDILEQLVRNLIDNAVRYNKTGGSVQAILEPETKQLTIADTGIGIPEKSIARVFERFYRVDKGRSTTTGGTGLGLAIVKHAAERLDAHITIESEVNKGTAVTVHFPFNSRS